MQTTGRANYRRMGEKCGVDFENNPNLIFSGEHALKPALAEWSEGNLNEMADHDDIRGITRRINGGYNGLADREAWFKKIRPLTEGVELKTEPKVTTGTKTAGTVVVAGGAAATQAPDLTTALIWFAVGAAIALVIYLALRKKG